MGMVEIPEPVIETQTNYFFKTSAEWEGVQGYAVDVVVGGVTVMTRKYRDRYSIVGENDFPVVADEEEAVEKALAEFGHKIRHILGEIPQERT